MVWPVIGAVIGAGASLLAADKQSDAVKQAGADQTAASQQYIDLLNQQRADAFRILGKYGVQGDWARNQIAAFLGAPQTSGNYSGGAPPGYSSTSTSALQAPGVEQSGNQTGPMPTFSSSWLGDHDPSLINAVSNGGDGVKSWIQGGGSVLPATLNKLTGVNPLDPLGLFGREKYDRVEQFTAPQQVNHQDYFQNNPDVAAEWASLPTDFKAKQFGGDPNNYAYWHAEKFGQNEGRAIYPAGQDQSSLQGTGQYGSAERAQGVPQPGDDGYKTPDQLQEEAWETYQKTPFAKIGRDTAARAQEDFTSMAGAQGSALSGRTMRGMAELGNEAEQGAFGSYLGTLSGMTDMGFQADAGTVSAGQNFATQAGGQMTEAARINAQTRLGRADAWGSALNDAAGWAGWAAGNLYNPSGNVNASRSVQSPGAMPKSPTPQTSTWQPAIR